MKKIMFKNKKGQVFLLLAIVILIYLILISTTVYRITQSPYIDPAPNQNQLLNYLDNSISNLQEMVELSLSKYSLGDSANDIQTFIQTNIVHIENYLDNHNLPATLSLVTGSLAVGNSSSLVNPTYLYCSFNISIHINSPDLYYDGVYTFDTTYYLEISNTAGSSNYIYLYKIQNGIQTMISNGIINVFPNTPISNLGDGRYLLDLVIGQTVSATLPHNIHLWLEV